MKCPGRGYGLEDSEAIKGMKKVLLTCINWLPCTILDEKQEQKHFLITFAVELHVFN